MHDEPLWSPGRLLGALRLWLWLCARQTWVPLGVMLRYHHRPHAQFYDAGGSD